MPTATPFFKELIDMIRSTKSRRARTIQIALVTIHKAIQEMILLRMVNGVASLFEERFH